VLLPLGEVIPFLNSNKYVIFLIYKQVNYLGIPYVIDGRSSAANSSIPSSSSGFPSSEPGAVLGIMGVEFVVVPYVATLGFELLAPKEAKALIVSQSMECR